jgi:hypothetical protein
MDNSERIREIAASSNKAAVHFGSLRSLYASDQRKIEEFHRLEREMELQRLRDSGIDYAK